MDDKNVFDRDGLVPLPKNICWKDLIEILGTHNRGRYTSNIPEEQEIQSDKSFTIHRASEAFEPRLPRKGLLGDLIMAGNLTIFAGDGGTKKSYLLLSMAITLAAGINWAELEVPNPIKTLYVDEELDENELLDRIAQIFTGYGLDPKLSNFGYTSLEGFDLTSKEGKNRFANLVDSERPDLIVLDALIDFMSGKDENTAKDTHPVMKFLNRLAKKYKMAVVVVHHTTKGGDVVRGHSAIPDEADASFIVTSVHGSPNVNIKSKKIRHRGKVSISIHTNFSDDAFTVSISDAKLNTSGKRPIKQFIRDFCNEYGEFDNDQINLAAKEARENYNLESLRAAINQMVRNRELVRTDGGGRGTRAIYKCGKSTK